MRIVALAAVAAGSVFAQGPTLPPPILQLVRRPGFATEPARSYGLARAAVDVLGMTAMTGTPESWFVESHETFASVEDLDKALMTVGGPRISGISQDPFEGDGLGGPRILLSVYQPAWSYRADQAIRLFPHAHYFHVSIYRIRAGMESDFGELVKLRRSSQDSVNMDRPDLAYEVVSGAPSGTYLFLAPIVSLRNFDGGVASTPVYAEGLAEAHSKARAKIAPDSEISREHLLFRVEPRLSYVSDDFASVEPEFWRGKQ